MPLRDALHPRRIQECFACCPTMVSTYAMMHLDSVPKIINHLLLATLALDILLFFSSWNVSFLPTLGFNTILVAFLLLFQTIVVWLILNNNRISALSFLAPTEFMVGVSLGITIGACILAFVLCSAFRNVSQCSEATMKSGDDRADLCGHKKRSLDAVWFWSGLVFWLDFCLSLLLAIGRQELTQSGQYETIGLSMDDYENHFRNHRGGATFPGDLPTPTPSYVGDYSSVPEIRDDNTDTSSVGSRSVRTGRSRTATGASDGHAPPKEIAQITNV